MGYKGGNVIFPLTHLVKKGIVYGIRITGTVWIVY